MFKMFSLNFLVNFENPENWKGCTEETVGKQLLGQRQTQLSVVGGRPVTGDALSPRGEHLASGSARGKPGQIRADSHIVVVVLYQSELHSLRCQVGFVLAFPPITCCVFKKWTASKHLN